MGEKAFVMYSSMSVPFSCSTHICAVKLKAAHIHLLRWGVAANINTENPEPGVIAYLQTLPPDEVDTASDLLQQIQKTFKRAEESSASLKRRKLRSHNSDDQRVVEILDSEAALLTAEPRFQRLDRTLTQIRQKYDRVKDSSRQKVVATKWALYERRPFMELVQTVSELVQELEKLFPGTKIEIDQRQLVLREVGAMDDNAVATLPTILADDDPMLCQKLKAEQVTRGLFSANIVEGESQTRMGHEYGSDLERYPSTDTTWQGNIVRGKGFAHLGHSFGGPSVIRPRE